MIVWNQFARSVEDRSIAEYYLIALLPEVTMLNLRFDAELSFCSILP
jgi:hypothetical protein